MVWTYAHNILSGNYSAPVIMPPGIVSVNGWPGHVGPIENAPSDNWINSMESLVNGLSGFNSVLMYDLRNRLDS
jgi:hypothetical protein